MTFDKCVHQLLNEHSDRIREYRFIKPYRTDEWEFDIGDEFCGGAEYRDGKIFSIIIYENLHDYSTSYGEICVNDVDLKGNKINVLDCITCDELEFNKELSSREDAIFDNDFLDGL